MEHRLLEKCTTNLICALLSNYYFSSCFSGLAFRGRRGSKNLESPCACAQTLERVQVPTGSRQGPFFHGRNSTFPFFFVHHFGDFQIDACVRFCYIIKFEITPIIIPENGSGGSVRMVYCPRCGKPLAKDSNSRYHCKAENCPVIFVRHPYEPNKTRVVYSSLARVEIIQKL